MKDHERKILNRMLIQGKNYFQFITFSAKQNVFIIMYHSSSSESDSILIRFLFGGDGGAA